MAEHGMVLISTGRMTVPTCLCGWIGAGELGASAFSRAGSSWEGHVELEKRLANTGPITVLIKEEQ